MIESRSLFLEGDLLAMWRTEGGEIVLGAEDFHNAQLWAAIVLKPTNMSQMVHLMDWLNDYKDRLDPTTEYFHKFCWCIRPLQAHTHRRHHHHEWFWTYELERAWNTLRFSLYTEWYPSAEYLMRVKWIPGDTDDWDSTDGEDEDGNCKHMAVLQKDYWDCI